MSRKFSTEHPELTGISKEDRQMVERFLKVYPAWEGYLKPGVPEHYIYWKLIVPSPVAPGKRDLRIHSDNHSRLTIYFDLYHVHFGYSIEEAFERAHSYIDAILNEEIIIAITWNQHMQQYVDARNISADKINDPSFLTFMNMINGYTCSWHGTYDRVYGGYVHPVPEAE